VDAEAECGFGFEGRLMRPGITVTDAELRPTAEYPETPVLLEYAQVAAQAHRGHNRRESLYVLWRFDAEGNRWHELGRAYAQSWECALELRAIAVRALRPRVDVMPDLTAIEARIRAALAGELAQIEPGYRGQVLAIIHDQLAAGMGAASSSRNVLSCAQGRDRSTLDSMSQV